MDILAIRGATSLQGAVQVSGAKNAALPIIAASLLTDAPVMLSRVPQLTDVATLIRLLESLGVTVRRDADRLEIQVVDPSEMTAPYELVQQMRASICVLGPLLGRRGKARIALPGGCKIGHRPIDLHLKGLAALGARIEVRNGFVEATCQRLMGTTIDMMGPSGTTVTGTCNILSAAVLAEGTTTILNVAREPEVTDLATYLNSLGARIQGLGTSVLTIHGVRELHGGTHQVIPDRIETGTLMMAVGATGGEVTIEGADASHLDVVIQTLRQAGLTIETGSGASPAIQVTCNRSLRPIKVSAIPYPGWPTDLQAQLTAMLTQAEGVSEITDQVFPSRFMHVAELARMGARIDQAGNRAVIHGPSRLDGTSVMASDLRASAALVIAGLAAEGETRIHRVDHLDRGYELLMEKLNGLGADVRRLPDQTSTIADIVPVRAA